MRITFLCQYFPPEMGAPSARTYEHARHWVSMGHEVTVITGFPNHPTGIIRPEYRGDFVRRERIEGIDLLRTWIYCAPNKGFSRRVLNFLSFFVSSFLLGAVMTKKPDVVVGTSPQFFCAVSGYLLSALKRTPFVFEVRDIWPLSAIELGALKNPLIIRALETIEMFLYRRAALIVIVAESTRPYLIAKGIAPEKIVLIPNGIDARYLESAAKADPAGIREELGLRDKFIVSYIGTHGMSHALDTVLKAAELLKDETRACFLFVGEGAEKDRLRQMAGAMKLENVIFLAEQPREKLTAFYRASDVSLVPLRRLDVFKKVLPSKMFELMGTGAPIICSVEGEAAALLQRAGAGVCIEPENADALATAIRDMMDDPAKRRRYIAQGLEFVRTHYLRSALAEKYADSLQKAPGIAIKIARTIPETGAGTADTVRLTVDN
ncbi:MAG: glycosyltransferase family 4 protein [Blastocatellia bacterium]